MNTPRLLSPVSAMLATALIISGCSGYKDSRLNPGNWFSRSVAVAPTESPASYNPLIPQRAVSIFRPDTDETAPLGALVREIETLKIEQRPGGAIIAVTGLVRRAGVQDVTLQLNESASSDSVLVYDLRSFFSDRGPVPQTVSARRVSAAISLTDQEMEGIRTVRVNGATNARETRR